MPALSTASCRKREQAFAAIDMVVATAQRTNANASDGITDMFAADTPEPIRLTQNVTPWNLAERLERERGAIGFHISAHPLDEYAEPVRAAEGAVLCAISSGR